MVKFSVINNKLKVKLMKKMTNLTKNGGLTFLTGQMVFDGEL